MNFINILNFPSVSKEFTVSTRGSNFLRQQFTNTLTTHTYDVDGVERECEDDVENEKKGSFFGGPRIFLLS